MMTIGSSLGIRIWLSIICFLFSTMSGLLLVGFAWLTQNLLVMSLGLVFVVALLACALYLIWRGPQRSRIAYDRGEDVETREEPSLFIPLLAGWAACFLVAGVMRLQKELNAERGSTASSR